MKKCLALSLMVIAIALVQVQVSYANAPVVSDPGDVIIGDLEGATPPATGTNVFIFPDAFLADDIVSDDATADADIKWSFTGGSGKYTINGVGPLDPSLAVLNGDDPTSPRASSRIDLNDDPGDPSSPQDGDSQTFTFRNADLSPVGGPNVDPGAGAGIIDAANPGTVGDQTQTITLFASDCTSFSSRTITVFTAKSTSDSLSGGGFSPVLGPDVFGPGNLNGWVGFASGGTSTSVNASGLCLTYALTADGDVLWSSPEDYWQLTANTVYKVRIVASSDGAAAADTHAPFFFQFDNFHAAGTGNNYGGQTFTGDIEGGNFAISRPNGWTSSDYMMFPPAGNTPQFIAGAFTPAAELENDPRIGVRVIDLKLDYGVGGSQADFGTVCVSSVEVTSILRDNIQTIPEYVVPLGTTTHFGENNDEVAGAFGTATVSFVGGEFLIQLTGPPNANGGTTRTTGFFDGTQPDANTQLHPVALIANAIYRTTADIRMVSSDTDPPDVIQMSISNPTFETGSFSYNTVGGSIASPGNMFRVGSPRLATSTFEHYHTAVNLSASITPNTNRVKSDVKFFAVSTQGGGAGSGGDQVAVSTLEIHRATNITANN